MRVSSDDMWGRFYTLTRQYSIERHSTANRDMRDAPKGFVEVDGVL